MAIVSGIFTGENGSWKTEIAVKGGRERNGLSVMEGDGYNVSCRVEPMDPLHQRKIIKDIESLAKSSTSPQVFVESVSGLGADLFLAGHIGNTPLLWRGPVGLRALYRTRVENTIRFSSAWGDLAVVAHAVKPVPPGYLFDGGPLRKVASLDMLRSPVDDAGCEIDRLDRALRSAAKSRAHGKTAISFSGGLDSAVLASYMPECTLISAGVQGSGDIRGAREAAGMLGREDDLVEVELTPPGIERRVKEVAGLAFRPSRMDLELGTVTLAVMKECSELGIDGLISGQGADELFGGYARYEYLARSGDLRGMGKELRADTLGMWKGFDRDGDIAGSTGVEIRYPYLDREVVKIAFSIPPEMKVRAARDAGKGYIRKFPLRKVALKLMPEELACMPKRAMQYGSGVHSVLKKLAKSRSRAGNGI